MPVIDDFKQIVKDANEYIAEHHFVISLLQPNAFNSCSLGSKVIMGNMMPSGGTSGPQQLFFYGGSSKGRSNPEEIQGILKG